MMVIEDIVSKLRAIESKLYSLAVETDHYYHYSDTEDIRIDVSWLIEDLLNIEQENLWTFIEEKRPRAGQFVLLKNEDGFVAFACRSKGTDDYFIRKGQKFHDPIAWTTKDRLCSMN